MIGRPVEVASACVADERNERRAVRALSGIGMLTPCPMGAGTSLGLCRGAMDVEAALTCVAAWTGTQSRWVWDLHPRGVLGVAGPLLARMGRRQEEAIWAGLTVHLEAGRPT